MTTLRQHIEDLDVESWAALAKRAAIAASRPPSAAAEHHRPNWWRWQR